jgi:hypothetical protein
MMMYIVKKPFKSMGKFYGVGSIIEDPTAIKRFKSKVNEGKVIVVSEDNLQTVAAYIKARSNVDILPRFTKTKPKPDEPKPNEPKPDEPKHVAKAKVVIKKK